MQIIITAAGRSERIAEYSGGRHKSLLKFKNETIIFRLVRQIIQAGYTDIKVVCGYQKEDIKASLSLVHGIEFIENNEYEKDKNILSLLKAYPSYSSKLLIVEADIILADSCISQLSQFRSRNEITWSTNGLFREGQYGAIIMANENGRVADMQYLTEYSEKYSKWYKNLGILYIPEHKSEYCREMLQSYAEKSWQYYFIDPLMDNICFLNSSILDFSYENSGSLNTAEDYEFLIDRIDKNSKKPPKQREVKFLDVDFLKHIEAFDIDRVNWLAKKIEADGFWTMPICVDSDSGAVMDGQHRMEVAKLLNLTKVPALLFNYNEVDIWSLRPKEYSVSPERVLEGVRTSNIYPYKTVKHEFPDKILECRIPLAEISVRK